MDDDENRYTYVAPPRPLIEALAKKVLFHIERGMRNADETVWKCILEKGQYDQLNDGERGELNRVLKDEGLWLVP